MAKTTRDVLAEYRANIVKGCEDATKALTGNKLNALRDAEKIIELNEKSYEKELLVKIYGDLMLKENPIESAIRMYSYKTIRHREKRDAESKRVIAYEIAEKSVSSTCSNSVSLPSVSALVRFLPHGNTLPRV